MTHTNLKGQTPAACCNIAMFVTVSRDPSPSLPTAQIALDVIYMERG
jgi:hypothetical protein